MTMQERPKTLNGRRYYKNKSGQRLVKTQEIILSETKIFSDGSWNSTQIFFSQSESLMLMFPKIFNVK